MGIRDLGLKRKIFWRGLARQNDNKDKQDGQERYENELTQLHREVGLFKREKKNVMSNLTQMLNELAVLISEETYDKHSIA